MKMNDFGLLALRYLPSAVKLGGTLLAPRIVAPPENPDDIALRYEQKRIDLLDRYQEALGGGMTLAQHKPDDAPAAGKHAVKCAYCELEEMCGLVRNHLELVASHCQGDKLGPATGGVVLKAKGTVDDILRRLAAAEKTTNAVATSYWKLAEINAKALRPKLEWINTCQEADEAATLAQKMWQSAAEATRAYYSNGDSHVKPGATSSGVILYHGTSRQSANNILKTQRFDINKIGDGADANQTSKGFFGGGIYFASDPEWARTYAENRVSGKGVVLSARVTARLFDATNPLAVRSNVRQHWQRDVVSSRERLSKPKLTDAQLDADFDIEITGNQSALARATIAYAKSNGFQGATFSPGEIIVWDTSTIGNITEYYAGQKPAPAS